MRIPNYFRIGFLILYFLFALASPFLASADFSDAFKPGAEVTDVFSIGCRMIDLMFGALLILTIFFVVYAAYEYLTSAGDADKVSDASKRLMYAAVAIVVGLLAKQFPGIIISILHIDVFNEFFASCT